MLRSVILFFSSMLLMQMTTEGLEIVAHRGASEEAPENTLAAFHEAWRQGADAIEGDFWLSKDGQIVCLHDADTKRVSGKNLKVAESDFVDLRRLDVGAWKGEKWRGERIPLLSEVLAIVPADKGISVEVKCGSEIVEPLLQEFKKSDVKLSQVTVISFDQEVIRELKKREPGLRANWLCSFKKRGVKRQYRPSLASVLATLADIGADGLGGSATLDLPAGFGKKIRDAGFSYHVWAVDDAAEARHFLADGAESLTTNKPAELRAAFQGGTSR